MIDHHRTSTTFEIPGWRVVESRGLVRGLAVRSRSIFGTVASSLNTLVGGEIKGLTVMCEKARHDAFEVMLAHAERLGANAVVGIRYDANEIMTGVTEVLCYGTAVLVERD